MQYKSTRNDQLQATASQAILNGLAEDGGLYMIHEFENLQMNLNEFCSMSYFEMAEKILGSLLDDYTKEEIHNCVIQAYTNKFTDESITPLIKLQDEYVLELFHGPTSAFKDVALSILPHLVAAALKKQNIQDEIIILTATSGDTGKAALEGFKDVENTQIFVFYPDQGVSAVQKAQMITQTGKNVHVAGVKGNFDDCQTQVKKIFMSEEAMCRMQKNHHQFSSANSINIGRLTPQIVYYFKAYIDLVKNNEIKMNDKINFVVPTGNFGNILAGYIAKKMGLPIAKLICASNENNVLTDFIQTGIYNKNRYFKKTISPSMDILVSSNLERLIYLMCDGKSELVASYMEELNVKGSYEVNDWMKKKLEKEFYSGYASDSETKQMIQKAYQETGYLMDTHTAVAYKVYEDFKKLQINSYKTVLLSTASPYKFTQSVFSSIEEVPDCSEFELMEKMNAFTSVKIPENLMHLDQKTIYHQDVIEVSEMENYVLEKLGD